MSFFCYKMKVNERSCRLCLKRYKSKKLKSIKSLLDNESIAEAIFSISGITTLNNPKFPSKVCIKCIDNLSIARTVRSLCINSDKYLRSIYSDDLLNDVKNEPEEWNHNSVPVPIQIQVKSVQKVKEEDEISINDDMGMDDLFDSHHSGDYFSDNDSENKIEESRKGIPDAMDTSDVLFPETKEYSNPTAKPEVVPKRKPPPEQIPVLINNQNSRKQEKPIYQCVHCGKICKDLTKLRSHERIHEAKPPKRFECDLCGKLFALRGYLVAHMVVVHTVHKNYNCEYCGRGFGKLVTYRDHVRIHTNERPFACSQCPKAFFRKNNLEVHMRIHTGERPFKCEHCEKTYAHYTDWRRHQVIHTGKMLYNCQVCGKGFIKKSCMTVHEKSHSNSALPQMPGTRKSSRIAQ